MPSGQAIPCPSGELTARPSGHLLPFLLARPSLLLLARSILCLLAGSSLLLLAKLSLRLLAWPSLLLLAESSLRLSAKPCLHRLARVTCYASAGHPEPSWPSAARAWVWWGEEPPRLPSPCHMWGGLNFHKWYHGIGTGTFFVSRIRDAHQGSSQQALRA